MVKRNLIMGFIISVAITDLGFFAFISIASGSPPLQVMPSVNLSQYAGCGMSSLACQTTFRTRKERNAIP